MTPKNAAEFKRVFTEIAEHFKITGLQLEDPTLEQMTEALRAIGLPVDEGGAAELERRWRDIQPALLQAALDPEVDAFSIVEPRFQAALDEVGSRPFDHDTLATFAPGRRAILVTRFVDGHIANSGWVAVFVEGQPELLGVVADGYRTLGMPEHAEFVQGILDRSISSPADLDADAWGELDERWYALPDPEAGRAAYVTAHVDEFESPDRPGVE